METCFRIYKICMNIEHITYHTRNVIPCYRLTQSTLKSKHIQILNVFLPIAKISNFAVAFNALVKLRCYFNKIVV